ncbi:hypothetical protein AMTR_s00031p00137300 [Amborella trichopoda]|uniref:Uncharacterized protein n=1 Tax=Amborella trichopoda TaxID=13333 RepID=U5D2B1_AMBTC|nr:hypothetical protein AMTR_s00031p00137300 [Amborella trichopoda]
MGRKRAEVAADGREEQGKVEITKLAAEVAVGGRSRGGRQWSLGCSSGKGAAAEMVTGWCSGVAASCWSEVKVSQQWVCGRSGGMRGCWWERTIAAVMVAAGWKKVSKNGKKEAAGSCCLVLGNKGREGQGRRKALWQLGD